MSDVTIGLLHPGEMGSAVGAALRAGGHRVVWASAGRGPETRARAEAEGLVDAGDLAALAARASVIVSVCPPHAARDVAREVAALGYRGTYVDGNAVAPATAREIGRILEAGGAAFVDGGIIGPPPRRATTTRLYLSGTEAARVATLFAGSPLEAIVVQGPPGAASAVKAAYAAWTKGHAALLLAVRALATHEGVDDALVAEWARSQPALAKRCEDAVRSNTRKAWRFVGEMEEIAAAFAAAGLPAGFHEASAEVYRRLAGWKDTPGSPSVSEVAKTLAP
jgi:3-hydroxyisobutyrate dehydrogenase-like beta-hydroxyacid dehydrogenase